MPIPTIKQIIAHKSWLLSHVKASYWPGKIFLQVHHSLYTVSFHGQILFNDHNINPVKEANVAILYFLNNQDNILENNTIPITAPAKKIKIGTISKFFIANIMVSYIHNSTSIKLPDIQGNIMAQMAIAQQIKVHRHVEVIDRGVLVGAVMKKANNQNIIKQTTHFQFHFTCLHKSIEEISIRPKKNDRIKMG